jgi:hypothetical protein
VIEPNIMGAEPRRTEDPGRDPTQEAVPDDFVVKQAAAKRHSHRQDANSRAVIRSGVFTASVITKPQIAEEN